MDYQITYIFPTRQRRNKAFAALDNIHSLSDSDNFEVILVMDNDDSEMNNDEVKEKLKSYPKVKPYWGLSANKVSACNREIDKISQDTSIVCLHSDDMTYIIKGFDTEIRAAFDSYSLNLDYVVHFPDSHQVRTMTYTMMGINMLKRLGYLYHPSFESVYCDNLLTEMAKAKNKYVFVNKQILVHAHPIFKLSANDSLYQRNEAQEYYIKDRETFLRLMQNNYGL